MREPYDDEALSRLRLVLMRLARRLRQQAPSGVTPAQLAVLSLLSGLGPQSIRALAQLEGVRPPTMSRVVSALEADGWVKRGATREDRRVALIRLTRKAEREMDALRTQRNQMLGESLAKLEPSDSAQILSTLPSLERLFDAGEGGGQ